MNSYKRFLIFGVMFAHFAFANGSVAPRTIFQVAPISALVKGAYNDGSFTYGELKKKGDFGLGTFLDLDGEMVALDGKFYQMLENGKIKLVNDNDKVPFAEVNYFVPTEKPQQLSSIANYHDLNSLILNKFNDRNSPYAIKVDGKFKSLTFRVLRKQTPPFKSLAEAAKTEEIITVKNVEGTLVGYWFPEYLSGVAVPEFHLHFISKDRTIGGHVLELNLASGVLNLEQMDNLNIYFPNTTSFNSANLSDKKVLDNINSAERNIK